MDKISTFSEISRYLKVYQETIKNFCNDFDIDMHNQFLGWSYWVSDSKIKPEFIEYLKEIGQFIRIYQQDNYQPKTIKDIVAKIDRPYEKVEHYLKNNYSEYFNKGEFYIDEKSSQKYVSSYVIDYKLGANYNFIKYKQIKNIKFEIIETIFKNKEFIIAYGKNNTNDCIGMNWINNNLNIENNYKKQDWFIVHNEIKKGLLKSILYNSNTNFENLINVLKIENEKGI